MIPRLSDGLRQSLDQYVRQAYSALKVAATVVGSITVLAGALAYGPVIWDELRHDEDRERSEVLQALAPGLTVERFEVDLGPPDLRSSQGSWTERIWVEDSHIVQAVSGADGSVELYSVTVCDTAIDFYGIGERTFDDWGLEPLLYIRTATGVGAYYVDYQAAANPTSYQAVYVGLTLGCPRDSLEGDFSSSARRCAAQVPFFYRPGEGDESAVADFRTCFRPRTLGITAPLSDVPVQPACESDQQAPCFRLGPPAVSLRALPGLGHGPEIHPLLGE